MDRLFSLSKLLALACLIATPVLADPTPLPISALPAASSVSGSDVGPIVQSGTTKKASFTVQKTYWDTFYQPLDGDLTALSALTGTHTIYYRSAASTWSAVTIGTGLDFTGATLSANGTGLAPNTAHYLTNQSETSLTNEINLGALSTGILKGTVSAGVSTISAVIDTTVGRSFLTLTNPSAITFPRINADNSVDALNASDFRTAIGAGTGGGDVSSDTSTSVDGEIALFKSTTGKLIQRATGTGVATVTSGVLGVSGTSTTATFGTIELGHASANTLSAASGVLSVEGVVIPSISSTNTFTNKRNTPRVTSISSSATPTINTDNCDAVTITALAANITSMTTNLSGTPNNFDTLIIRFKDDGTARTITWGSSFASSQATLPTTTVISKVLTVGLQWDSVKSKWICLATDQEP